MVAINSRLYGCNNRKDRGEVICKGLNISRKHTDRRLLSVIRDELMSPSAMQELEAQVQQVLEGGNLAEASGAAAGAAAAGRAPTWVGCVSRRRCSPTVFLADRVPTSGVDMGLGFLGCQHVQPARRQGLRTAQ